MVLFAFAFSPAALAEDLPDTVVLRTPSGGQVKRRGIVESFNGRELTMRTDENAALTRYRAEEVVRVETPHLESHEDGLADFEAQRYDDAARHFTAALEAEQRAWVRRDILAMLVRCALAAGDPSTARARFHALVRSDPLTSHFHLIPLAWTPHPPGEAEIQQARAFLVDDHDAARLMGASVLLLDSRLGDSAEAELKSLVTHRDPRLRGLARAQTWRLRMQEGHVSPDEARYWLRILNDMPKPLRGGPYYVIGNAFARRNEHEEAARMLLWLPLVYDDDPRLAARALVEAADALRNIGQTDAAFTLYREAATRFDHTPFAQDARAAIEELVSPGTTPGTPQEAIK